MAECPDEKKLVAEVQAVLAKIIEINKTAIDAVNRHDHARIQELAKDLEHAVGEKERAMGAWRQHKKSTAASDVISPLS